jgi:hypothetical protein
VYAGTKRLSGVQILVVAVVTLCGILLVVFPNASTRIANLVGIGRGTDLILYLAVIGGLFIASNFYFRFKRQEAALIALARRSAIDHAHEPQERGADDSGTQREGTVEEVEQNLH